MEKIYLITGTTGFLGREVAKQLTAQQKKVIGLRLPGDKAHLLPKVEYITGPEDYSGSYMTETIKAFLKGYFPCAVEGGYDFADVRDVADGIIKCAEKGKSGKGTGIFATYR